MQIKFSEILLTIVEYARQEAARTGWKGIGPDHLMLGILRHSTNDACRLLRKLGIDLKDMKSSIDSRIFLEEGIPFSSADEIELTKAARSILSMSVFEALKLGSTEVLPADLLAALSRTRDNVSADYLKSHSISAENITAILGLPDDDEPEAISQDEIAAVLGEQLNNIFNTRNGKKAILS